MIEVRRSRSDELAALAALRLRWVTENAADDAALPTLDEFTHEFVSWASAHAETHFPVVAVSGDEPIGLAWLAIHDRVPSPRASQRRSGDLQSCYVVPEARCAGVGRALVHAVLEWARELGCEHVTVHASRESVTLYQGAGFRQNPRLLWADAAVEERN